MGVYRFIALKCMCILLPIMLFDYLFIAWQSKGIKKSAQLPSQYNVKQRIYCCSSYDSLVI